ncbi:hypothetical protein ACI784_11905 [Geodermatophilus sp. SYSU D01186]
MTRTRASRALWTASAAAAVGLGVLAASVGGADASPAPQPASATASPSSSSSAGAPASAPADPSAGEQVTVAGVVSATCDGGGVALSGTPAAGWWLDDSQDPGQVEFENATQELEVHVACADGTPQFFVEGPRADDSGRGRGRDDSGRRRGRDDSAATPAPTAPTRVPAYDDSTGRIGGGHGSDDGPGDDSRGRSGGGHGSDD